MATAVLILRRRRRRAGVGIILLVVLLVSAGLATAATRLSTKRLGTDGGTITFAAVVTKATTCAWSVSPKIAGFKTVVTCSDGRVRRRAKFKPNTSENPKSWVVTLTIHGKSAKAVDRWEVTEAPGVPATTTMQPTVISCTNPTFTTSDAEGSQSWDNDYYWTNNDAWNGNHGPQTLYACSPSSWYAVSNQPDNGGAVETYPDTEYDVGGRGSTPQAISTFSSVTSSFAEQASTVGQWDAGYDIWTNNWGGEVMIWNQASSSLNGIYPKSDCVPVTIAGVGYCEWNYGGYGSEVILERDTQVASGSVDILATLKWLETQGLIKATDTLTQIEYGIEVSSTAGGPQTFAVTNFTVNAT
jgi:hypothetical protein